MKPMSNTVRRIASLALVALMLSSVGCSWWRGRSGYENSPESRPLEVPPDLDTPAADPSMQIPAVAGSTASTAPATGQSFVIGDVPASAWRRLGLALERIDGVTIDSRAELLSVYNVSFGGSSFLVKIAPEGEGSRISTVSEAGQELTSGAPGRLLALLKERLG
jgi:uncharacterized lipoprotein